MDVADGKIVHHCLAEEVGNAKDEVVLAKVKADCGILEAALNEA